MMSLSLIHQRKAYKTLNPLHCQKFLMFKGFLVALAVSGLWADACGLCPESGAGRAASPSPHLPGFILLVSFSGTLLVVSILGMVYDSYLGLLLRCWGVVNGSCGSYGFLLACGGRFAGCGVRGVGELVCCVQSRGLDGCARLAFPSLSCW